ncbi:unnamed protein product, partial [Penicillium bialowiezense]
QFQFHPISSDSYWSNVGIKNMEYTLNAQDISLLREWTKEVPTRCDDLVHHLFGPISIQFSDKPAVYAWDGDLTYRQLDNISSQLAWHLQSLGAGPEKFIPVCLEKSRWVIVAVLAIIKSGGVFVLLDPSHPTERLKNVCQDVQAHIMITSTQQNIPLATQQLTPTMVDITGPNPTWLQGSLPTTAPASSIGSTNAVWCAFTSGSSGRPKGVVIEHSAFCSLAAVYIERAHLTPRSRVLQFASYAFDACITDILATLLAGGCICIPSEWERRENLGDAATRMQVNWANLTPTVFRAMVPLDFPTLEIVILSGEPMTIQEVRVWQDKVHLMNVYGPAEGCVKFTLQPFVAATSDLSNIGFPMVGDCWVVNPSDHNELVPIGETGELVLGGPRIGRGYINNPVATAASFISISTPWLEQFRKSTPGTTRLYKTGDLVQYAADGSLRFVGRKDFQVKIRGQRVEINEIEATIQQSWPLVKGVVVDLVSGKEQTSPENLTAFIEIEHNCCGDSKICQSSKEDFFTAPCRNIQQELGSLEKRLKQRLPVYIIPTRLLLVRRLPTNTSGKTDRKRLRDEASNLGIEDLAWFTRGNRSRQPPSTLQEEVVLQACAEVLKLPVDSIGMNDSFFHLGGDSILAMQFVSQARKQGVFFRIVDIFQNPNLMDLTTCTSQDPRADSDQQHIQGSLEQCISVEDVLGKDSSSLGRIIYPENIQHILPMTDGQILRLHEPCKFFVLRISGGIDSNRLSAVCLALVRRHEILRSVFRKYKSSWVQLVLKNPQFGLSQHKTEGDLLSYVKEMCEADKAPVPPIDVLPAGFSFVQGPEQQSSLIIRLTHAMYDGYSWKIISSDLKSLWDNLPLGKPAPYSTYVQQWTRAQNDPKTLEFWQNHLNGSPMTYIGDVTQKLSVASTKPYMVEAETWITPLEPPTGITLATVVKVAWALTLARLSEKAEVAFGLTTSGRSSEALTAHETVGACISQVAVSVHMSPHQTVRSLMESVQQKWAESLEFELFQYRNTVGDDKPIFGSVLNFQNTRSREERFELGDAQCWWVPLTVGSLRTRDHVELEVIPRDADIEIWVGAPNTIWTQRRANEVLHALERLIPLLAENTEAR